jgi:SAM-dependent methyltransferase
MSSEGGATMTRKIWNHLAKDFEAVVCDVTTSSGPQLAELVKRTRPHRSKTLVDAGCGIGSFAKRFGRHYGRIVAFDFAGKMVDRARERCDALPNVAWSTLGLEDAATRIGTVGDLVVCLNVITATDADLRRRQWTSLAGITQAGGYVIVVVPALESACRVAKFADEDNRIHDSDFDAGIVYRGQYQQKHYSRDELRTTIDGENLRVLALKRIHYPWSDDGVDDPGRTPPWSWVALARKRQRNVGLN